MSRVPLQILKKHAPVPLYTYERNQGCISIPDVHLFPLSHKWIRHTASTEQAELVARGQMFYQSSLFSPIMVLCAVNLGNISRVIFGNSQNDRRILFCPRDRLYRPLQNRILKI